MGYHFEKDDSMAEAASAKLTNGAQDSSRDMEDVATQLEALFQEAGDQHHEAFLETDGDDPEWPLWYADWLVDKLPALLGTDLTKSELVYLLVHLGKEQQREAPDMPWPRFYAGYFAREYAQGDSG